MHKHCCDASRRVKTAKLMKSIHCTRIARRHGPRGCGRRMPVDAPVRLKSALRHGAIRIITQHSSHRRRGCGMSHIIITSFHCATAHACAAIVRLHSRVRTQSDGSGRTLPPASNHHAAVMIQCSEFGILSDAATMELLAHTGEVAA